MNILEKFKPIKMIAMDVDGVLTNGSVLLLENGQMARTMNIKDGYALQLAVKKGYHVVVISGGEDDAVKLRLNKLGIKDVFLGTSDKKSILQSQMQMRGLNKDEVLFIGDDMPDADVMRIVGLPVCPADAVPDIKEISDYYSPFKGGEGCVRDVIEKVLRLNNHWTSDADVVSR